MKEDTKTLMDRLVDLLSRDQNTDSYTPPEELAREVMTLLRPDITNEAVFCPACEGAGTMDMKAFPSGEDVRVLCPVCYGSKFIYMSKSNKPISTKDGKTE
jgi:hypothetical protein